MSTAAVDGEALRSLVQGARTGDPLAAERLVREHEGWLRSVVFAVVGDAWLVDDTVQQVWARVWEHLDGLRTPDRLRPWLYQIARRTALDVSIGQRRQRQRERGIDNAADSRPDLRVRRPDEAAEAAEAERALLAAVQRLDPEYREPFVLRHLEDWSYAQIAEVLELSEAAVESRLVRARRQLRERLGGMV